MTVRHVWSGRESVTGDGKDMTENLAAEKNKIDSDAKSDGKDSDGKKEMEYLDYHEDDDLSCYFCEKEITQHKISDGKLICERIDDDTNKPYTYRAWEDVVASENSYTNVFHGDGEIAYKMKMLPPMVVLIDECNGSIISHWKDNVSGSSYSDYVNPRGIGLFQKFMNDPELKEQYDKSWQTTIDGRTGIITRERAD